MRLLKITIIMALTLSVFSGRLMSATENGNSFALYYSEARNDREREELFKGSKGKHLFFRYLQIIEMENLEKNGRPYVRILAFEPSSFLDVRFFVTKPESLKVLWNEPATKIGDAIAVTGILTKIDFNEIEINPVIVRNKDRLLPKRGKEYLYEVDPSAVFYSYTGGDTPVHISYMDRDLLRHQSAIMAAGGKQAWTDFLLKEKTKRDKAREQEMMKKVKAAIQDAKGAESNKEDGSGKEKTE